MKHFYKLQTALLFIIAFLAVTMQSRAQSLSINANAPRNEYIINNNGGTLSSTTYNYVRVPEGLVVDSIDASGNPFRYLHLSWMSYIDTSPLPPGVDPKVRTGFSSDYLTYTISANVPRFGVSIKLINGTIVTEDFLVTAAAGEHHNFAHTYYTSTNNGASYIQHTDGLVKFTTDSAYSVKMQHNILEEQDGTLYTCAYIRYVFSTTFRTYLLKSTDKGKTWVSVINTTTGLPAEINGPSIPADEGTLSRCPDGSWLVVMKHSSSDPDVTYPLWYSTSTNKGQSWSTPTTLPGIGSLANGKAPGLLLMPNGVLALTYGTPDVEITFSADGGGTWTTPIATYPDPHSADGKRPSGNTWVSQIDQNTVLQYGDYYAKTLNPNTQGIWQQKIEVVRPEQNRIDLQGRYKADSLTIVSPTTTLNSTFPSHIEARATAAFDGSTNYWASAIGTTSGDYELDLHRIFHIKSIGVALLYGVPESATIYLSPDGTSWTAVKTYSGATHYCLNYTSFASFDARYVKVHVSGTGQVGLSELELYETASTFENNATMALGYPNYPHGILPAGYAPAGTSSSLYGVGIVRGGYGYHSDRAMLLDDNSGSYIAGVKKVVSASNSKTLEFRCRPAAIPVGGSFSWKILGTVSGSESVVFFFAVFAETSGSTTTYKIKANNGSGWTQVGSATMPVSGSVWKLIRVVANESGNQAKLYVDTVLAGTTTMYSNPANTTNLTGFAFASNGTATTGEFIYFDDIDFYDPTVGPNQNDAVKSELSPNLVPDQPAVSKAFSVNASPNPANGQVQINVANAQDGNVTIVITNMSGKILKQLNYQAQKGNSSITTSIQGYKLGVYVITAKQNTQIAQSKLDVY